jgi:hypothetical protein
MLPAGNYTSGGKTYYFYTRKLNFTDAMDACLFNVSLNARLVNFLSAAEQVEVEQYFITNGYMNSSASYWYGQFVDPSSEFSGRAGGRCIIPCLCCPCWRVWHHQAWSQVASGCIKCSCRLMTAAAAVAAAQTAIAGAHGAAATTGTT